MRASTRLLPIAIAAGTTPLRGAASVAAAAEASPTNNNINNNNNNSGGGTCQDEESLSEVRACAYFARPLEGLGVRPFALGAPTRRVSPTELIVRMDRVHLSPIVEVGSRVHVWVGRTKSHEGRVIGGIVGRLNSNGTLGVLLDNNTYSAQVPQSEVCLSEGRSSFTLTPEYARMHAWVRDAGVRRHADLERICSLLYQRGWRANDMYQLRPEDVHCMVHLKRSVRLLVLEKAEWQREFHADMRTLLRERVKEREPRYFVQKFSGFVSATWAGLGVMSVFLWNFKNYRRQQRSFQLKQAVNTLTSLSSSSSSTAAAPEDRHLATGLVSRDEEENWARQTLRQMSIDRPRVAVLTGFRGCGKSSLFRTAVRKEQKPALFVDVRGQEDTLRCVLRSLKVSAVEACGDPLDFITDAFTRSARITGEAPLLVINLRQGTDMARAYNECVVLSCDRMLCHLVFEVAVESLTLANTSLPRLDFYMVPNFNMQQAYQYTQHSIDPVAMSHFVQVVGTNSVDIDELFAAVHHRRMTVCEYTNQKLSKAMRLVQAAAGEDAGVAAVLERLSLSDFDSGHVAAGSEALLAHPALKSIVLYDPVQDRWFFRKRVLHTAARCSLLTPPPPADKGDGARAHGRRGDSKGKT